MQIFDVACELWLDDDISSEELKRIAEVLFPSRRIYALICNHIDALDVVR